MKILNGKEIPTQLHTNNGNELTPIINRVVNRNMKPVPQTGLWTSSYIIKTGSSWIEWCEREEFNVPKKWTGWLLDVKTDAKVVLIDSKDDLNIILNNIL